MKNGIKIILLLLFDRPFLFSFHLTVYFSGVLFVNRCKEQCLKLTGTYFRGRGRQTNYSRRSIHSYGFKICVCVCLVGMCNVSQGSCLHVSFAPIFNFFFLAFFIYFLRCYLVVSGLFLYSVTNAGSTPRGVRIAGGSVHSIMCFGTEPPQCTECTRAQNNATWRRRQPLEPTRPPGAWPSPPQKPVVTALDVHCNYGR